MQEMITTWAERMETKGLERGRKEGRREGRQQATLDLVLRLLTQRFGQLPAGVRRQVTAIDSVEDLGRLAERVYQAGSLEELGLASS